MRARADATSWQAAPVRVWQVFAVFALGYFFAAMLRAVPATLAPVFVQEFAWSSGELGLLAGAYFLGFAVMQLPMGRWLDQHGPKRVLLVFLTVAAGGCGAFAVAHTFTGLWLARLAVGAGVAACLMAALTGFRRWLSPVAQMRASAWMMMTGSLGMLASTLPVQWVLPHVGWRGLFAALGVAWCVVLVAVAWCLPRWPRPAVQGTPTVAGAGGYRQIFVHPYFRRMWSLGFFNYGGMLAMQTLWIGPWLMRVGGQDAPQAATGLFALNLCMLVTFGLWGVCWPWATQRGWSVERLIVVGGALSLLCLAACIALGSAAPWWGWALFCMCTTCVSLVQPAMAQVFAADVAGRALSAYNLVIFSGVFAVQWGLGALIEGLQILGWEPGSAFRGAMLVYLLVCLISYGQFVWKQAHNDKP